MRLLGRAINAGGTKSGVPLLCLLLTCASVRAQLVRSTPRITSSASTAGADIDVVSRPGRPYIEQEDGRQFVNFDVLVHSHALKTYVLVSLKVRVYDTQDRLEIERELNQNGKPPALDVIGDRILQPGSSLDLLQPFDGFGSEVSIHRLHLELFFMEEGHSAPAVPQRADRIVSLDVEPEHYDPVPFCLPLQGLLLVHDGHDFYSHHRRYSLLSRDKADPRSAVSANLYAYDFVRVAANGVLFLGNPRRKENWLTYGAPIFAPADGVVLKAIHDIPENTFDPNGEAEQLPATALKDPLGFGNYVTILHADGRVSWLLHMSPDSLLVKSGDRVFAGQRVGKVGFSGDSLFPHLHYNVTDGQDYPSQGVPSYFKGFARVLGGRRVYVVVGQAGTGDFIEQTTRCRTPDTR